MLIVRQPLYMEIFIPTLTRMVDMNNNIVRIVLVLTFVFCLNQNVLADPVENDFGIINAWYNGQEATVENISLTIGEPAEITVFVYSKIAGNVYIELTNPLVTVPYVIISGPSELDETIDNYDVKSGWTMNYTWIIKPNGDWTNRNAPINLFVQFNKAHNDVRKIEFTIANPHILDEQYSGFNITPTNVTNTDLTTDSVTITWDTDEDSDSVVRYGTTSGYYLNEQSDAALVSSHSISLTGLSAATTYYYLVNSTDASGNAGESSEYSFTTATIADNTTVVLISDAIAAPNGYAFTSITVNNVTGLGSGDIIVTYNSSVVHAINVTSGDGNALTVQDWYIDNTAGLVQITAWDADESHNGDVIFAHVTFHAIGEYLDSTLLAISSSELIDYTSYGIIGHNVSNGTFSIISNEPPVITDAIATPDVILNDNGRPRTPGTNVTLLNATVLNGGSGVVNVTIDLSPIGGSDNQVMERITGTDVWTVTTTATDGINLTHELVVTATDGANNTNTSVIELTVLMRGDVVRDGDLNSADALYIAKYLVGKEPRPSLLVSDMSPAKGDGRITSADALYLAKYLVGKEAAP